LRKDMIEYAIPFSMGKRQCAGELWAVLVIVSKIVVVL
jgi:hypothetical protein